MDHTLPLYWLYSFAILIVNIIILLGGGQWFKIQNRVFDEFIKQTNLLDNQLKDENTIGGKLQSSLDVSETGQGHQSPSNRIKPGEELPEQTPGEEPRVASDRIYVLEELPVNQPTFEDNLMRLNMEWHETVQGIERMCLENHRTTNQWWDFTQLKRM